MGYVDQYQKATLVVLVLIALGFLLMRVREIRARRANPTSASAAHTKID